MRERLEPHMTPPEGPLTEIRLQVAESSLPRLLEGVPVEKVWLTDNRDGTFTLCATGRAGQSREQRSDGKTGVDVLVELVNAFADEFERIEGQGNVPEELSDAFTRLVSRWAAYPKRAREGS